MPLYEEMEKTGNWLFKRRSYLPMTLYIALVLVLWLSPNELVSYQNLSWCIICLLVNFFGIFIRAITIGFTPKNTSGRNTHAQVADVLNTSGIYAHVRHPLYLGNYFMWLGFLLYVGNFWFVMVVSLIYWLYYERIMLAEEEFLRRKFKNTYEKWAKNVPAFIPKFQKWKSANLSFSFRNVLKREYSGLLASVVSFAFINMLKNYFYLQQIHLDAFWLIVFAVGTSLAISLRTIKKTTNWLEVAGR